MKRNYFLHPNLYDWDFIVHLHRRNDLHCLIKKLSSLSNYQDLEVLDYGGGSGQYRPLFNELGIRYLSADISGKPDIRIGPNGNIDLPDGSVDIVLSLQVLEHIENVPAYLAEAARILKPGGILWLTTHGIWHYHPSPIDYHRWTLAGLRWQVSPDFSVIEENAMIGPLAYAPWSYLKLCYLVTRVINSKQNSFLNRFSKENRWGKDLNRKNRIRAPALFYPGNILLYFVSLLLNPLIFLLDWATPASLKRKDSAIFRLYCQKRSL